MDSDVLQKGSDAPAECGAHAKYEGPVGLLAAAATMLIIATATALFIATREGHVELVEWLLGSAHCDVHQRVKAGGTPALIAATSRKAGRLYEVLTKHGADVNVIDLDGLTLHLPEVVHDLPAGGRRLHQRATGYEATIVAGQVIRRFDQSTGARPGQLVRGSGYRAAA